MDKAVWEQSAVRREELRSQEERFLKQIAETRDLKMIELQSQRDSQREGRHENFRVQRWPLPVLPIDILERSKASGGASLNVILKIIEPSTATNRKPDPTSNLLEVVTSGNMLALRRVVSHFKGDVLFYPDSVKETRYSGDSLATTLWSCLRTEPVVLIEVYSPQPERIVLSISHWGNALDMNNAPVVIKPQVLNFATAGLDKDSKTKALAVGLSIIVTAMGDAYRTLNLHMPGEVKPLVFPSIMQESAGLGLSVDIWRPVMNSYLTMYDLIGQHSPLVASELAAQAALVSHSSKQTDFANLLLDKALALHPALPEGKKTSESNLKIVLLKHRGPARTPSELENALAIVRDWKIVDQAIGNNDVVEFVKQFGA
jgi:hypothetical protein